MERRLAAILAADVVGYSRFMAEDEAGTLTNLTALREHTIEPLVREHQGRVVKTMGDGLLVEFQSAVAAVNCALAWQERCETSQDGAATETRLRFRIGVNLGEVVVEGTDIYGDGVNVAARLEGQAVPGGVCISEDVYRQVRGKVSAEFEDLGKKDLKNIPQRVRVFQVVSSTGTSAAEAPASYQVRVLGRFEIVGPQGPVAVRAKKLRGLIAYLSATHPEPQSRETLMALFWGSHFDKQARQNLRQSIARLKQLLGPEALVIDEESVGFRSHLLESDIGRLKRAIRDKSPVALRAAGDISSADLLAGLSIAEENWSEWLESERPRVHQHLVDALVLLSDLEFGDGNFDAALHAAERALDLDPLREDAFRSVVRALERLARGSDAINRYVAFTERLQKELGVSPAEETLALVDAMRASPPDPAPAGLAALPRSPQIPAEASLAVIPFRNITKDERAEIIANGLAEDIVTTLAKISAILVVARESTRKYQDEDADWEKVSREQGVRHVLEGAVWIVGDRVRVTAHLSDATTGRQLWADRFDRWFKNFLDIQDEITKEVVSALQVELTDGEQARIWARGTEDTMAWENIVVATELIHAHHRDGIPRARRLAEEATKLDPEYAAAWAAVGWTYWVEGRWGWADSAKRFDTAVKHVERALALDPDNPDALTLRGVCALHLERFDEALATMEEAMLNAPGHAHIVALTGYVHRYAGDPKRVVSCMERAIRLSPVHPAWYESVLGCGLRRLGRTAQAVELLRDATQRDPDFFPALAMLASLLGEIGEVEEAKSVFEALQIADPTFSARKWCDLCPFRDDAEREREFKGLMKARASA